MSDPYFVTGAVGAEIHPRLEIRDLSEKYPEQFTLFIKAWATIMEPQFNDKPDSHVQIGGIHGLPYERWPGDPESKIPNEGSAGGGYCNHGSILFPTWHRPYVLLMEQSISRAAQSIASGYAKDHPEESETWLRAARELRFPFWDWTDPRTGQEGLPKILYQQTLVLKLPKGETESHENILAFYRFDKPIKGFNTREETQEIEGPEVESYFRDWKRTYRWPNATRLDPKENIPGLNKELTDKSGQIGGWENLTKDVASCFNFPVNLHEDQYATSWDEFSNTTFQSRQGDESPWHVAPLEQSHNIVHVVVGGAGHMCDNDTAGFDPIFYLHHCNVDRLLTFWEQIYPDYIAGTKGYLKADGKTRVEFTQSGGTYMESVNQVINDLSPLFPFRKENNSYWTTQDTHSVNGSTTAPKNYTYPPINGVSLVTTGKLPLEQREIQRAVLQKSFGFDIVQSRAKAPVLKPSLFTRKAVLPENQERVHSYRHFVITTSLSATAYNGSYIVKVYLSTPHNEVFIGAVSVLGRGQSTSCAGCQSRQAAGTRVRGVITIPNEAVVALLEDNNLNDETTSDERIIEVFKQQMRAMVVLPGGTIRAQTLSEHPGSEDLFLADDAKPSLHLHSAVVSALKDDSIAHDPNVPQEKSPLTPYEFNDWMCHGPSVSGHWVQSVTHTA